MKKILIALLFTWPFCKGFAQEGIQFEKGLTWEQILKKAKATNKYIFVDFFASWCGQCKWMDDNVFNSKNVGEFYNKKFISIKVQMDTGKADHNGIINEEELHKWQAKYKVIDLPTYLFFDFNGKAVHRMSGTLSDSLFINLGRNSLNPVKQYYTLINLYNTGKLSIDLIPNLVRSSKAIGMTEAAKSIAKGYINNNLLKQTSISLMNKSNLEFISENLSGTGTPAFKFFMDNREKINKILGPDRAEYAIRSEIAKVYLPKKDLVLEKESNWNLIEKEVAEKFGSLGRETVYGKRMSYYLKKKDWTNFGKYYMLYFELALKRPEYNINGVTWPLFLNVTDPEVIDFASNVMKYAIEQWYQNNPVAWDTYANLLYKGGKRLQAIEWEERAVKLKKGQPDENLYTNALEKMKNNQKTW